ncbi:MAG: succinylglutamate desuccinylase/aspartoacylase family protein [Pseudomonadota bacterium]|nr:succinylglutamate desuccinylase/aspartoacylase family protein [Pseudomonadota bacterium]
MSQFVLPVPALERWREGNTGVEGVWSFDAAEPGPQVLVTALIHGNELCGAWAVLGVLQAGLRPRRGTLTLAFCNLDAFDRFDLADPDASRLADEDLNRVWGPGVAQRPATREQRRALALLPFVERADWLLDLHSMSLPGPPLLLTGTQARNVALARLLGTPAHIVVDAGHSEGRRMRDHGRFAAADAEALSLLLECGEHGELASRDVAIDSTARFLVASGCAAEGDIPMAWRCAAPGAQRVYEVTEAVTARSANVRFADAWRTGQTIAEPGTLLGWNDEIAFHTPYPGCMLVMPSLRRLRPGATVVRLAREVTAGPAGA